MNFSCSNPTLLIYLMWVYAIPALLNTLLAYDSDVYVSVSNSSVTWLYGGLLFAITAAFAFRINFKTPRINSSSFIYWEIPLRPVIVLLVIFLLVGVIGAASGLSQWRYAAEELSVSLNPISLLFVLAPNVLELILFTLLFFNQGKVYRFNRMIMFMLAIGAALTASGIVPMIGVLIAVVATAAPLNFRRLLLKTSTFRQHAWVGLKLGKLISLVMLIIILSLPAYFVGVSIKSKTNFLETIYDAGTDNINVFLDYLVGRISVHWYSTCVALYQVVEVGAGDPFNNLMAPVTNSIFRLSTLTGGLFGFERPVDGSMSRINYGLVTLNPFREREGTSPGLIATFILAFPIWIGPLALACYLWVYNKIQSGLRRRFAGKPTIFGEILILYFTSFFFSSPVDFLLVFDPTLLSLLYLSYLGLSANTKLTNHEAIKPGY